MKEADEKISGERYASENMFDHVKNYVHTVYQLYRLEAVDKISSASASAFVYIVITVLLVFVLTLLNIGVALWIGSAIGNLYAGFFILASFYLLLAVIFYFSKKSIKRSVTDAVVNNTLN